jgi:hypothetical protein
MATQRALSNKIYEMISELHEVVVFGYGPSALMKGRDANREIRSRIPKSEAGSRKTPKTFAMIILRKLNGPFREEAFWGTYDEMKRDRYENDVKKKRTCLKL